MTAHSNLGPSSAHRWLTCPGSVAAIEALPIRDESSPWAAEGTLAHDVGEKILKGESTPDDLPEGMFDYVEVYVEYVQNTAKGADALMVEERVDFSDWVEGGFGTADAIVIHDETMHVIDLKYGMGVKVDADENPQGMLYALGAYSLTEMTHDIKTVVITIVQPRLDHISEWSISTDDLLRWAEWVRERAEIAREADAPRVPGEKQCRFCDAKATCKALQKYTEAIVMADFDDLDEAANPDTLTDDQLRQALEAKPVIEGWLTAVEAVIKDRLEAGEGFPGFKLVAGRSLRQWENEALAEVTLEGLLGDEAYSTKLLSPAQAEKKLGKTRKGEIEDLIIKPQGKPTLAPESDKRPAINVTTDDFEDLS